MCFVYDQINVGVFNVLGVVVVTMVAYVPQYVVLHLPPMHVYARKHCPDCVHYCL